MSLSTRTARLAADVSAQLPTSFTLESWRGNAFDLELGVFDGATVQDLADVSSITCIVRNQSQSGIAMTKTVASADIDNTLDSASWQDESKQHVIFSFTNSETNVAMGSDLVEYWMVFTAIMNDGAERTLAAGCFNLYNDRNNTAGNPPSNPGTSITLEQADARYLQAGDSVGDMLAATYDPTSVEGDAFAMDNMVEGADAKVLTAAERAAITSNSNELTSHSGRLSSVEALAGANSFAVQVNDAAITSHTSNTSNPHSVTAAQVGLGSADNTSDADKPISTATQAGLDGKQDLLTVSETAPVSPDAGDLWLDSTQAKLYTYYNDGDSSQWVSVNSGISTPSSKTGWMDYNDSTGSFSISADTWTDIPNDGAGSFTNKAYKPIAVSDVLDDSTGYLDFSDLPMGSEISLRNDITVTPNTNNALFELRYVLGTGAGEYALNFLSERLDSGSGVAYQRVTTFPIYMGDTNTKNNPGKLQARLSTPGTIQNAGVYASIQLF